MRPTSGLMQLLTAGFTAAIFAAAAVAAPVTYQESVSGDLPGTGQLPVFVLDIGVNTIKGTFGRSTLTSADLDSFAFTIPSGTQLTAGSFTWTDSAGDVTFANWLLFSGSDTAYGGTFRTELGPGNDFAPLSAGLYNLTSNGFVFDRTVGVPALADITFSLTLAATEAVPEPGTLVLAGLALAGLAATGRRNCRQRSVPRE